MNTKIKLKSGTLVRRAIMFVGVFLCIISLLMSCVQKPPDMEKRTQELKDLRWGMFICWSFSTFSGREWTTGVEKNTDYATLFPAKTVDTDQWARVVREAGMGYILFLTKHHDVFCLWDTKTTERKVTNAPLNKDVLVQKIYKDYLGAVKYGNIFSLDAGPDYEGKLRETDVKTNAVKYIINIKYYV